MKYLLILLVALATVACTNSARDNENRFDTNAAETAEKKGETDKENAETNEEAWADSAHDRKNSHDLKNPPGNSPDNAFAVRAAEAGVAEVELGELASKQGSAPWVKEFGRMMVTDHSRANEELKELAKQKNITLPVNLCQGCQAKFDSLNALKGSAFDRAYVEMMVRDHKDAVSLFTNESTVGQDAELKKWAGEKLQTLKHHLTMSEDMKKKMPEHPTH
jgi:putative membrane protein